MYLSIVSYATFLHIDDSDFRNHIWNTLIKLIYFIYMYIYIYIYALEPELENSLFDTNITSGIALK